MAAKAELAGSFDQIRRSAMLWSPIFIKSVRELAALGTGVWPAALAVVGRDVERLLSGRFKVSRAH